MARQFGRSAADVPLSFPQQFAVGRERQQRAIEKQWERIDRGEQPDMGELRRDLGADEFDLPAGITRPVTEYMRASPEQRREMEVPALEERAGYRAAESGREAVEEALPRDPQAELARPFGHLLAGGAGSTVGFMAAAPAGLPGIASAGMIANANAQFREAMNEGASFEEAAKAADLSGLLGLTEAAPIARALDVFNKASGGTLKRAMRQALQSGTEEPLQEITQAVGDNLIAAKVVEYDPERGLFEGTGDAAGMGFSVGSLMGFLASALGPRVRGPGLREEPGQPAAEAAAERMAPELGTVEATRENVARAAQITSESIERMAPERGQPVEPGTGSRAQPLTIEGEATAAQVEPVRVSLEEAYGTQPTGAPAAPVEGRPDPRPGALLRVRPRERQAFRSARRAAQPCRVPQPSGDYLG